MFKKPICALFLLTGSVLFLTACAAPTPKQTRTPTQPSPALTATPSPSPARTLVPTRTLAPTHEPYTPIPTQTPTPTPLPTFAPATPLADNGRYKLARWSPDKADSLIRLMLKNAIDNGGSYFGFPGYRLAPSVTVAQSEALIRFPKDARTNNWRWGRAYSLAVSTNGAENDMAGEAYAGLIVEALKAKETVLGTLNNWFEQHQDGWSLTVAPVRTPPQYRAGYTISFGPNIDELGGTCLLLLEDKDGFHSFVLVNGYNYEAAEVGVRLWRSCGPIEMTGDSIDEIHGGFYYGGHASGESHDVFWSLDKFPPQPLSFGPNGPYEEGGWNREVIIQDWSKTLPPVFISDFWYSCQNVTDRIDPRWNGQWLEELSTQFDVNAPFDYETITNCWSQIKYLTDQIESTENVNLMRAVLGHLSPQIFPPGPTTTPQHPGDVSGEPSVEIIDEYRYRLGLNTALTGSFTETTRVLTDLVANPTISNSTWIAPAQQFLAAYQSPDDLYRACAQAHLCQTGFAIERLVKTLAPETFPLVIEKLHDWGVPVLASGLFDFDGDGDAEWWFTTHAKDKTEFWVLSRWPHGIKALFVSNINGTPTLARLAPDADRSIIQLNVGGKPLTFAFVRLHTTDEPFVSVIKQQENRPVNFAAQSFRQAENDLFSGTDPATIHQVLLAAQESHDFNCKELDCAKFVYILGLTYELTGDENSAIDTYLQLWREYPDSPYTIMARAKLDLVP
jgi:hypothetical protein